MAPVNRTLRVLLTLGCLVWVSPAHASDILSGLPFELHGFVEAGAGIRTQNDPHQSSDFDYAELRLQFEVEQVYDWAEFKFRLDVLRDEALGEFDVDLREGTMVLFPLDFMDMKVGRQVLTWGTGDLVFLNDLFPKDFESFFIGRDETYLKAPTNGIKTSFFFDLFNFDLVWVPLFESDRFLTGERLSFFNSILGRKTGERSPLSFDEPDTLFKDSEVHGRIFKNVAGYELALYGYYGFFKNPGGADPAGRATFPRLAVYGASVRGKILKGIGNIEVAYHDSLDDSSGTDPAVNNSQFRFLIGYTQELVTDFSIGLQYNLERRIHHDRHSRSLPPGVIPQDQNRHLFTVRLTERLFQQNLTLSLFAFYSPSDGDAYLRPSAQYKISDSLTVALGANVFAGANATTFFGQLKDNTNVYARMRYSY